MLTLLAGAVVTCLVVGVVGRTRRRRVRDEVRCVFCSGTEPAPFYYERGTGWYHMACFISSVDD